MSAGVGITVRLIDVSTVVSDGTSTPSHRGATAFAGNTNATELNIIVSARNIDIDFLDIFIDLRSLI